MNRTKISFRILILASGLLLLGSFAIAQTATISGQITDTDKNPVEDISIGILGSTAKSVSTDKNGKYEYSVPADKKIVITNGPNRVEVLMSNIKSFRFL